MNQDDIERMRQRLLQLRAEVQDIEEMSRDSTKAVALDQTAIGRVTRMDAIQAQQMSLANSRRRQEMLLKIEHALRRIDTDEYGCCFVCGEEIDFHRLGADPTNTRCLACAQK